MTSQLTYDVPPSEVLKHKMLSYCAERWTAFKTSLCKRFIHVDVEEGVSRPNPCNEYTFLDEATWKEFYRMKTTPETLVSFYLISYFILMSCLLVLICLFFIDRLKEKRLQLVVERMIALTDYLAGVMKNLKNK